MVRDALSVMLEGPVEEIQVEVRPHLSEELTRAAVQVRQARVDADTMTAAATEAAAELARKHRTAS